MGYTWIVQRGVEDYAWSLGGTLDIDANVTDGAKLFPGTNSDHIIIVRVLDFESVLLGRGRQVPADGTDAGGLVEEVDGALRPCKRARTSAGRYGDHGTGRDGGSVNFIC